MAWMEQLTWPRETERLTLRPARPDDLATMWEYRRLEEVGEWMGSRPDRVDTFVAEAEKLGRLDWTVVVEQDGVLIGDLMLRIEDAWGQDEVKERTVGVQAELGWCFTPAVAGQGLATEAVAALIRIGFDDVGLRRLTALCFAANEPSWRLMERVGMRREAYNVQDSLHRTHGWVDGMTYALLAGEWAGRDRLG